MKKTLLMVFLLQQLSYYYAINIHFVCFEIILEVKYWSLTMLTFVLFAPNSTLSLNS
jgi:hypothetical protein